MWGEEPRSQALTPVAERARKEIFLISTLGQAWEDSSKWLTTWRLDRCSSRCFNACGGGVCVLSSVFGIVSLQETEIHLSQCRETSHGKSTGECPESLSVLAQLAFIGTEGLQAPVPSTFPPGSRWSFISASLWLSASYYLPNVNSLCNVTNLCFPKNSFFVFGLLSLQWYKHTAPKSQHLLLS